MSERIENIRKAVEKHAGCRAEHRESVPVTESYLDQIMWEGVVEVFDLDGHPTAKRAYGGGHLHLRGGGGGSVTLLSSSHL